MSHIKWDDTFSVGVELIDSQHQLLFQIINRFYDAIERKENQTILSKLFHEVLDYTTMHFSIEETMMKQCNYPDIAQHQEIHKRLIARAGEVQQEINRGVKGAPQAAMLFLTDWLEKHIKGNDKQYTPFMTKLGAA
jgi:hemerythrin